jgi:hypothetical protein
MTHITGPNKTVMTHTTGPNKTERILVWTEEMRVGKYELLCGTMTGIRIVVVYMGTEVQYQQNE